MTATYSKLNVVGLVLNRAGARTWLNQRLRAGWQGGIVGHSASVCAARVLPVCCPWFACCHLRMSVCCECSVTAPAGVRRHPQPQARLVRGGLGDGGAALEGAARCSSTRRGAESARACADGGACLCSSAACAAMGAVGHACGCGWQCVLSGADAGCQGGPGLAALAPSSRTRRLVLRAHKGTRPHVELTPPSTS